MPDETSGGGTGERSTGDDVAVTPDEFDVRTAFDVADGEDGDGTRTATATATDPARTRSNGYWFDGEGDVATSAGEPFTWAMAGAALYAASFVFAGLGLQLVAPAGADLYVEFVTDVAVFLPLPVVGYATGGLTLELFRSRAHGELPETVLPITLLLPVFVHLTMFYVEGIATGFAEVTFLELLVRNPGLAQLVLWPPIVTCGVFAVIAYQTTLDGRGRDPGAPDLGRSRSS